MKMKTNINMQTGIVWMACLMLGVAMAACSSDADEPENNDGRKLRQLTITDVPMTRATLTDNDKTLGASWEAGDKATYFNLSSFTSTNIDSDVLTASSTSETTIFTGTVRCNDNDQIALIYPKTQLVTTGNDRGKFSINLADQKGTLSDIAEHFHYLSGVAQVTTVTSTTANAAISSMEPLLAVAKFVFKDANNNAEIPVKTLKISYANEYGTRGYPTTVVFNPSPGEINLPSPEQWEEQTLTVDLDTETSDGVYVALLPCGNEQFNEQFFFSVTGSNGTYTGTASAKLAAGKYYPVTLKLNKAN
ncbi:MAG: fimbrillin family protein [Prevotella sp.]|nr:fimbrillin family protein [Prevotella sp.]